MQVDIQDLLESANLNDPVYPGKKLVKKYSLSGAYKSHCVVFDWLRGDTLHIEVKAGLSGKNLDPKELKQYPVSFQAPTYLDIVVDNDNEADDEDEDEDETKGKSGGGGKKPKKRKDTEIKTNVSLNAFDKVTEGTLPDMGTIEKFVVMGKELAKEAYATAFENLKQQLSQTKIMAMDLMKGVGDVIKKATPGGGLEAKGDESIKYKYDSERNGPMFGATGPS